jgi:ankyrin repeat protein
MNTTNKDGKTPLHYISASLSPSAGSATQLLVDEGVDVNAIGKGGKTPLHYAAASLSLSAREAIYLLL